ncbi:bifunctional glutamate--cysteine ligase GshA/glutathione synthetase GshB [Streptococcus saliviloxodontae]|uniref:Glutathione biosynthesis bifunctional protein GshAB n=1 Tax=Streptococcus saliviloxodontae TaxID=1349416 RepID=A0ABS2PJ51_9STRE|nr:bifunctional glutamate--cysteine ligase GshA/glutathione synthetase GshB [Streptococcus saliviloxodontae]MBM7635463.1 glutamate--cysteine ligase [Streptococcus saliviloxodontae]
MHLNRILQESPQTLPILQATFGLERESLRISQTTGRVSQHPHPKTLGSRSFHPYIQTDYSEPQIELITPIAQSTKEALRFLGAITDVAERSLDDDDYLWPLSMPPRIEEDDITIAQLESQFECDYRQHLADVYGKKLQSMSGIHFNMELGKDVVASLFETSHYRSLVDFKNDLHLKLAQNFLRYKFFLTYLFGASPIAEQGFFDEEVTEPVRSLRNSSHGYVNHEDIKVSYQTLEQYISDIEGYVASGQLIAEKEFYSAVRLRGSKRNRDYLEKGVSYLEFRCFDINPFDNRGITQETLDIIHLFALSLLWIDKVEDVDKAIQFGKDINEAVARSHPLEKLPQEAPINDVLTALHQLAQHFQLNDYYLNLIDKVKAAVADPSLTIGGQLFQEIHERSLESFGRKQGQAYKDYAWTAHYALKGYETMELSTQMLLFDVIQKGVNFQILDESDQFLKLWHGEHIEYIKNGNMTSKDNYIIPLAMANKVVTKKILAQAGFPVPAGDEFDDKEAALAYYPLIQNKPIVVKPKSTNFGLGISIFQEAASLEDYEKALDIAFKEDSSLLVEEFVAGTEYRFFVLDGKCEAVLLRVAANVVGDGKHTIAELVDLKNQNPLRGRDHRSPLEIINLGDIELLMLDQQGFTPETVLDQGQKADLRGNSNISTGGDSIDVTEKMHPSYKELAADMATAMGAWACGVDLIIPDASQPSSKDKPNGTCIELNFNPSMYMHTYCHEGPGQAITPKILAKLFPEIRD